MGIMLNNKDQKAVKSAAETMRPNPKLKIEEAITELGVGEALVSMLDEKGRPTVTERAFVVPPGSRLGPLTETERRAAIESAAIFGHYEKAVDRESAYEKLKGRTVEKHAATAQPTQAPGQPAPAGAPAGGGIGGTISDVLFGRTGPRGGRQSKGIVETAATSAARAIGSEIGRQVLRGVLGSILGKRR